MYWESLCLLTGLICVEKKISGQKELTGVLALSCLNLPPSIGNNVSHLCLAGITPKPFSTDSNTINHLLCPLVDEIINLENGILIPTHQFPAGCLVQMVAGYTSHLETKFCSFCQASPVEKSRTATAASIQDNILKQTGLRWLELNRLAYWDPIRHVVLGIMHNWLEGILQDNKRKNEKLNPMKKKNRSNKLYLMGVLRAFSLSMISRVLHLPLILRAVKNGKLSTLLLDDPNAAAVPFNHITTLIHHQKSCLSIQPKHSLGSYNQLSGGVEFFFFLCFGLILINVSIYQSEACCNFISPINKFFFLLLSLARVEFKQVIETIYSF
ncbi:hypothetical protein VP01_2196g9 [Puccinia sorghi]|uniref:Uncharacterized protein n=1 Tax=Puccinia sorghi TaxID=27349 RepID=A0A0L6VAW1_9BASI|nr:hypothetical protein VP01_2196g9 [Puccinia sorghi]